ncbi:hypothetical protein [Hyphomicrobium sp. CS1GBMeth3]|uniref:hypothetical protein n=1 Tax=Hyphomicrobium sp. CS1GBMeth3 TaxID=1892845 RepID=UPI0009F95D53|nr:hypothetical protein [Hyphomicrobium sp. CS1GBMeth3]
MRAHGLIWCATFVVLDAAQAVLFGSFLQRMDSLLLGLLVFGMSSLACLAFVVWRSADEVRAALAAPRLLAQLNISTATGWLAYLGALQLIEPAVAFTIFSGIIPVTIVAARVWGDGAGARLHGWEARGLAILVLGLVVLAVSTLAGFSGFVRGGGVVALVGLSLAAFSGVAMSWMLLVSFKLNRIGVSPAGVFAARFPLYLLLAVAGYLVGLDNKGPVAADDMIVAVALGLVVLAFPIYAVQQAVALTSALTVGAATALIPVVVLALQMLEGRVAYSSATAMGLAIYTVGAVIAAAGRARTAASASAHAR